MRVLIVTVAGTSSRFEESLGRPVLKCVYHEGGPGKTLLGRLLRQANGLFDRIVVVGGYRFDELRHHVKAITSEDLRDSVELVENPRYAELASGWSLHLGIDALSGFSPEEVVFVEGDLFLDDAGMRRLCSGCGDAVSTSPDPVTADRSVALYRDALNRPRYAYSASHGLLEIREPFLSVESSGQAWRFGDADRLFRASRLFASKGGQGTNLEIINPYFAECDPSDVETVAFHKWVNCNTVQDWERAFARGEEEHGNQ